MSDDPIRLKAEDQPDPHTVAVSLLDALRDLVGDSRDLQRLLTRWGDDPSATFRRAQARSVEMHEAAARALDAGERLVQMKRLESLFSFEYEVQRGR